jgi:hypothetical protein
MIVAKGQQHAPKVTGYSMAPWEDWRARRRTIYDPPKHCSVNQAAVSE